MSYAALVLTAGFAMFSMFFGSGNLVFPLMVGAQTQSAFHMAAVGLLFTGVFVPFLGLVGMLYFSGNRPHFFSALGKPVAFIITLFMLSLLGPFAVVPRCALVAHGGFSLISPETSPVIFNAFFLVATLALAWKKTRIIEIIGTYLTPLLLGGILLIIGVGLSVGPDVLKTDLSTKKAFFLGLDQGYQTMDLLAAFFFSATTVAFIAKALVGHEHKKNLEKLSLTACCMGGFLLSFVYIGFVMLGAKFSPQLMGIPPEKMLVSIAQFSLGAYALPLAANIIGLACLTTAGILASIFTDFIQDDLCKNILGRTVPRPSILILTVVLAYALSLMGFSELASWISFVLVLVYPALIAYTILSILSRKTMFFQKRPQFSGYVFGIVMTITLALKFL